MEIDNKIPYNITVNVELNVIDIQEQYYGVMCAREREQNCIINCYVLFFNQFKFTNSLFFLLFCFSSLSLFCFTMG